jgi:hypothetical protein
MEKEKTRQVSVFDLGRMYFFRYDPAGRYDLPYYDTFPLVLVLEMYSDGFLGLNMHYLPVKYRLAFLDKLMDFAVTDGNQIQRMRVSYDILNASRRFREFRPCLKKYLHSQVKSKILQVMPNEWDVAVFLPVYMFKGKAASSVWKDSINEITEKGQ